jgi:hypothetical protein
VRGPQFSQTFWNQFVYNGFESPTALQPLRRLTAPPMVYLKTVDEAGKALDPATLNTVEDALRGVALSWTGGAFSLAGVQRGTGTMAGQRGWLTVRFLNPTEPGVCGRAPIGSDGGVIELDYLTPGCSCAGSRIRPRAVMHELGHAFGYWHTDSPADLMYHIITSCDASPSDREVYHAGIAYQSPVGSTGLLPTSTGRPIVIVN